MHVATAWATAIVIDKVMMQQLCNHQPSRIPIFNLTNALSELKDNEKRTSFPMALLTKASPVFIHNSSNPLLCTRIAYSGQQYPPRCLSLSKPLM